MLLEGSRTQYLMRIANAGLPYGVKDGEWGFDDQFPNIQDKEEFFHILKQFLTSYEDYDHGHRRMEREAGIR